MLVVKNLLSAKIKGLAEETKKIKIDKKNAFALRNEDKAYRLAYAAREFGIDTRHYLIAYAFIRNVPYRAVEGKTNQLPNKEKILAIVKAHGGILRQSKLNPKIILLQSYILDKGRMEKELDDWLADNSYVQKPQPKRQKASPELVEKWRNEKCRCGLTLMGHP